VDRLNRTHRGQQVLADRVEVDGFLEPGREGRDDRLGVVPRPVEAPCCKRCRSGLKSAAAASVEAATATGDENGSTRVVSATTPTNTPTSIAVRSAYEIVRLTSRSIS
jgi:hypothetical protein